MKIFVVLTLALLLAGCVPSLAVAADPTEAPSETPAKSPSATLPGADVPPPPAGEVPPPTKPKSPAADEPKPELPKSDSPKPDEPKAESADPAETKHDPDGPRARFELFGMDDKFFASFVDDEPFVHEDMTKLLKIVIRLGSLPLADVDRWAGGAVQWRTLLARPAEHHGELFKVEGRVTRATLELLEKEVRERFQIERCYRCAFQAADGTQLMVFTPAIPKAWLLDEPIDERASLTGIFLKRAKIAGAEPQLVMITHRVAWHLPTLLGQLKMDVGLLDTAVDRRPIGAEERECFYEMLAAVGRSKQSQLTLDSVKQMEARKAELQETMKKPPADPKQASGERRELARLEEGSSDVVPLFNHTDESRGKLVTLLGDVKRAIPIQVNDPDIVSRFGIRQYYEMEMFPEDSQANPVVFCLLNLPEGMPISEDMSEEVRATGFFVKSWAYRIGQRTPGAAQAQLAPLIIGRDAEWIQRKQHIGAGPMVSGFVVLVLLSLVGVAMGLWRLGPKKPIVKPTFGTGTGGTTSGGSNSGFDMGDLEIKP